jgi:hypothetical protein
MFHSEVVERVKIRHLYLTTFPENRAVCEIVWNNIVERGRPQMTTWRMRFACWIPKAISTHSEYVILIDFPLPQLLHERISMLRYAYIASLVIFLTADFLFVFC